jgi:large-conductance mechanosensitive channel
VAYGWLTAGVLTFVVIALGVYVRVQQIRLARLRDQLAPDDRNSQTTKARR